MSFSKSLWITSAFLIILVTTSIKGPSKKVNQVTEDPQKLLRRNLSSSIRSSLKEGYAGDINKRISRTSPPPSPESNEYFGKHDDKRRGAPKPLSRKRNTNIEEDADEWGGIKLDKHKKKNETKVRRQILPDMGMYWEEDFDELNPRKKNKRPS